MIAEEKVFSILSNAAPVAAFVGTYLPSGGSPIANIHETHMPVDARMPGLAYVRDTTQYFGTISSSVSLIRKVSMRVVCLAKTATAARQLAALVEAIDTIEWSVEDRGAAYDDEQDAYAQIFSISVDEKT